MFEINSSNYKKYQMMPIEEKHKFYEKHFKIFNIDFDKYNILRRDIREDIELNSESENLKVLDRAFDDYKEFYWLNKIYDNETFEKLPDNYFKSLHLENFIEEIQKRLELKPVDEIIDESIEYGFDNDYIDEDNFLVKPNFVTTKAVNIYKDNITSEVNDEILFNKFFNKTNPNIENPESRFEYLMERSVRNPSEFHNYLNSFNFVDKMVSFDDVVYRKTLDKIKKDMESIEKPSNYYFAHFDYFIDKLEPDSEEFQKLKRDMENRNVILVEMETNINTMKKVIDEKRELVKDKRNEEFNKITPKREEKFVTRWNF